MRFDRLLTLYVADLLPARLGTQHSVPVLMYHSISVDERSLGHPYFSTSTSPRIFAAQMSYLAEHGYVAISLEDLERAIHRADSLRRRVVITFDDGYSDFYSHAFPILHRHGFHATVFVATAYVGRSRRTFNGMPCLTWSEIRDLSGRSVTFGSHTVTHPQLRLLENAGIERELVQSRFVLEQEIGMPVTSFAYPYGFPCGDRRFVCALRNRLQCAGYRTGVCTSIGRVHRGCDQMFWPRLPINSYDDIRLFSAKIAGAYDWMAFPQAFSKRARHFLGKPPERAGARSIRKPNGASTC